MQIVSGVYELIQRWRRAVLIGFTVVIVGLGYLASRLQLDSDLLNLLPEDLQTVKTVRKLQGWSEHFAAFMYLGMVRDGHADTEKLKEFAEAIGRNLEKSQWVQAPVDVGVDVSRIKRAAPLFMDPDDLETLGYQLDELIKQQRKKESGFFFDMGVAEEKPEDVIKAMLPKYGKRLQVEAVFEASQDPSLDAVESVRAKLSDTGDVLYYMSDDGEMLTFIFKPVFPPYELTHYPELVADVDQAIADARSTVGGTDGIRVLKGGAYPLQWDQREMTLNDARQSGVAAGLLILLVLFVTIRRPKMVGLLAFALVSGLLITFGLTFLVIGTVNIITIFLLAILAGLGIDFGLYFATRFRMCAQAGLGTDDAVREAWRQTAIPALMGALTTMAVMVLLAFGRFRGFAELGVICSIGILSIYVCMYGFLPVLVLHLIRVEPKEGVTIDDARRAVAGTRPRAGLMARVGFRPASRHARPVVVATVALTAVMLVSAQWTEFTYTGEELTVSDQRSFEVDREVLKHYGENTDQTVVLADTEAEARRIHEYFQSKYGEFETIARYESPFSYAPPYEAQKEAMKHLAPFQKAISRLPGKGESAEEQFLLDRAREIADARPIAVDELPTQIQSLFVAHDRQGTIKGYMGAIKSKIWLWGFEELERFVAELDAIRVDGKRLQLIGRPQLFLQIIQIVKSEAMLFSAIGLVVIFLMFWAQARRPHFALLAMLPLVTGVIWMLGAMPWIGSEGVDLNFVNLIAFPILTGLGVSYGVHVVHNYRLYGSAEKSLQVVARPVLGSALTTLVGWGSLVFASMTGMRGIGTIASIGMVTVTVSSVVALPALLAALEARGLMRAPGDDDSP